MITGTAAANAPTRTNRAASRASRSSETARSRLGTVDNKQPLAPQVADELQDVLPHG